MVAIDDIVNMRVRRFGTIHGRATEAQYQDAESNNYAARLAGWYDEREVRDYITFSRRHDANRTSAA